MTMTASSLRARTVVVVSVAAAAMLMTVFGVRSVIDPNQATARADTVRAAAPALSIYDMQVGARGLPVQEFKDPI